MLFSLLKILQTKSPWKPWFYRILVEWPPLIEGSRHRRYCVTSSNWQTKRWPSQIQLSIFHLFVVDSHWSVVAKLTLEASQITAAANDDFLFFLIFNGWLRGADEASAAYDSEWRFPFFQFRAGDYGGPIKPVRHMCIVRLHGLKFTPTGMNTLWSWFDVWRQFGKVGRPKSVVIFDRRLSFAQLYYIKSNLVAFRSAAYRTFAKWPHRSSRRTRHVARLGVCRRFREIFFASSMLISKTGGRWWPLSIRQDKSANHFIFHTKK